VNGELKPVLNALISLRKQSMWTEIVYLVVPTLNDSDQEFKALAKWIRTDLGLDVPVHFSRFHPEYLLKNLPPTALATLERRDHSSRRAGPKRCGVRCPTASNSQ
ncbi:MAG: hypothetical protein ACRD2L_10910, partial [Terriglobia bacterium]